MKRTLLTAATTSVIALVTPALASATHHSRSACHHRAHRACEQVHRARHARVIVFGTAPTTGTTTGAPAPGPTSSTPAGPDETAGSVASFTGGVLTITLTDGSTVSGKVTEETEIHCMATAPAEGLEAGHGGEGGDDSGEDSHGGPGTSARAADRSPGGSDDGGDGEHGESSSCTSSVLTHGAVVREAELSVSSGGAVWDHVDVIQ